MADEYYWCLKHSRVEGEGRCGAAWIRGPFDSEEAARNYADRADKRNEAWEEADEEWNAWPGSSEDQ